jgi:uncharacterized protein
MSILRRQILAGLAGLGAVSTAHVALAAEVRVEPFGEGGVVGVLHYPADRRRRTTVVMLNGSDGGIPSAKDAADLAASGYVVLALAYFSNWNGQPAGLPAALKDIPLEYVFRALDQLKTRPQVDARKIVLMGQSRGAELALLVGSLRNDIAGVVAFSPSSYVWHAVATPGAPAWTLGGKPVPFRDTLADPALAPGDWFVRAPPMASARIRVENIKGPVMLISSRDDKVWPASAYADEIAATLAGHGRRVTNLQFDDASHLLMGVGPGITRFQIPGATTTFEFGGTVEGNTRARREAWAAAKRFLAAI